MQATWDSEKESLETEKRELVEDHQSSLAKFQELIDKEREDTAAAHAKEITSLKDQISSLTTSYEEKLAEAGKTLKETVEAHKLALETLATEKDALISSAEESKAEIVKITAAMTRAQELMMVHFTFPGVVLTVGNATESR